MIITKNKEEKKEKIVPEIEVSYKSLLNSKELAQAIKSARTHDNISINKLAMNINEKESLMNLYETPGTVIPQYNVIKKLEKELRCKLMKYIDSSLRNGN